MRRYILLIFVSLLALSSKALSDKLEPYAIRSIEVHNGLTSNNVKAICQDQFGFMWFGTKNGLNRFDGRIVRRYNCYDNEKHRGNNNIGALCEIGDTIWVGTDCGVYLYNQHDERFTFFDLKTPQGDCPTDWVRNICRDEDGCVWILVPNQGLFRIKDGEFRLYPVVGGEIDKNHQPTMVKVINHNVYVGTSYDGLYVYNRNDDEFQETGNAATRELIHKMSILTFNALADGRFVISGMDNTLLLYDPLGGSSRPLDFLAGLDIYQRECMVIGHELWVGTSTGLMTIDLATGQRSSVSEIDKDGSGLSDAIIYSLFCDREGNVWAGTMFGGVNFIKRNGLVFERIAYGVNANSLCGRHVRGMTVTDNGCIWIGFEDGGVDCLDPYGRRLRSFPSIGSQGNLTMTSHGNIVHVGSVREGFTTIDNTMSSTVFPSPDNTYRESVYSVLHDSKGNLWVGLDWGMKIKRVDSESFETVKEFGNAWIFDIFEASDGTIWFASMGNGVWTYQPSNGKYRHYPFDEGYSNGLRSNSVSGVAEDSKGRIWLSTDRGGLSMYDKSNDCFVTYSVEEGLPDNVVYNVLEDNDGYLWFGTNNALVKFNPEDGNVKTFSSLLGSQLSMFNYNSAVYGKDGRFYFGGVGGVIAFDPLEDVASEPMGKPLITRMKINNQEIDPGSESPMKESLLFSRTIKVRHSDNTIIFSVSLPQYTNYSDIDFSYRLQPGDKEWINVSDPQNISFLGLSPGNYDLEIRAEINGSSSVQLYRLEVIPAWYESWWAIIGYFLIFVVIFLLIWHYYKQRQEREMAKKANILNIKREKELYKNKITFFTEIAHEIRTPLSLIGSPLEAIEEIGVKDERVNKYLNTIRLNTNRLLDLTSHLLDFEKIDSAQHDLIFTNVDVTSMVQDVLTRFEPTMSLKKRELTCHLPQRTIMATIDKEAVTKIVSNLFNNALKYSEHKIDVTLDADDDYFSIIVASDGAVIEGENRLKIFEPFFQLESNGNKGGVGIGLPLCSTLAKMHSGSLVLADSSTLSNTFILKMPLHQEGVEPEPETSQTMTEYVLEEESVMAEESPKGYSMLFVEDNDDMRQFLQEQLSKSFDVETACNGVEALKLLEERRFDIIVTDIMMPEMDGYELCRKVKSDADLSNIPLVFLTAKNDLESKVAALKCGGEAYIEKPFSIKYFRQQVMSLLDNRQHERRAFMKKPFFTVDNMKLNKADEEFMNKVVDTITDNISDENFTVETMSDLLCMSRSSLLRRIKSTFNLSPIELIRLVRLKKAAELIQEGKYRIGDVCFMVGINSSSYFSKLFCKQFGLTPKAFEKQCQAKAHKNDDI